MKLDFAVEFVHECQGCVFNDKGVLQCATKVYGVYQSVAEAESLVHELGLSDPDGIVTIDSLFWEDAETLRAYPLGFLVHQRGESVDLYDVFPWMRLETAPPPGYDVRTKHETFHLSTEL